MNSREIEHLLEKYFNGETSLTEEQSIRDWFAQDELPLHHKPLKAQFMFFSNAKKDMPALDTAFEDRFLSTLKKQQKQHKIQKRKTLLLTITGIAASILIVAAMFFQNKPNRLEDSLNDPEIAYLEIQQALIFVSGKLNQGLKPAQKASDNFNEGLEQTRRISKLYEVQNLFMME